MSVAPPLLDVAAYHRQQAAEKSLKALLVCWDLRAEKTHDIGLLLERATAVEPSLATSEFAANFPTPLATAYRYPADFDQPEPEEYEEALDYAETIYHQVLAPIPGVAHP